MSTAKQVHIHSVLVIGGCGFLGHHIVRLLLKGHPEASVAVIDINTTPNRFQGVQYFDGDITSRDRINEVVQELKPQVVMHTASPIFSASAHEFQPSLYRSVNIEGTRILLEAAQSAGTKAFVYTSTASVVYNGSFHVTNVNETAPIAVPPLDVYTETKATAEREVIEQNRKKGILTCSLRVSGMFGEGDRQCIPGMIKALDEGKTRIQLGSNTNLFDFTYVENSALAHILAAEKLVSLDPQSTRATEPVDGEIFFITNDEPQPFWDMPRKVWKAKGYEAAPLVKIPYWLAMILATFAELFAWLLRTDSVFSRARVRFCCWNRYFDITKAKSRLGYRPIVSIQDGILRTVKALEQAQKETHKKEA